MIGTRVYWAGGGGGGTSDPLSVIAWTSASLVREGQHHCLVLTERSYNLICILSGFFCAEKRLMGERLVVKLYDQFCVFLY